MTKSLYKVFSAITILALVLMALPMQSAQADSTAQPLPFSQNWTNTGLITTNDDWSGAPGIIGYRGDGLVSSTAVDPQTVIADGSATPVDINVNQTNPNTFTTGGVTEFEILDPVVAFQGSGTADAPHIVIFLNTTGQSNISISYNLRDVDGSIDNAIQPVALQFRVGSSGNFTNVPAGYVVDATTGPSLATLVTPVSAVLPASANNQPLVQVRVITTDAVGSDELVGVDDINIVGSVEDFAPSVANTTPANGATNVAVNSNITVIFSENVDVAAGAISVDCPAGTPVASNALADNVPSVAIDPASDLPAGTTCAINVTAGGVTDEDGNDPPDTMDANFSANFSTAAPPPTSEVVISQIYAGAGCGTAGCSTYTNDYIELYNRSVNTVNITGWSVQYASATGTSWQTTALSGSIAAGQYYLVQEGGNANGVNPLPMPNATGSIAMGAAAGKVALVNSTTALSGTGCPIGSPIVDFVGYGATANCSEGGAPAPAPSTTTAIFRAGNGATDTDNNAADFAVATPNPRNTPPPLPNLTINDVSLSEGNSGTTSFDFTVSLSSPAGAGGATFDIATADNTAMVADNDYGANSLTGQTITSGNSTYTFSVLVNGDTTDEGADETFFVNVTNVTGAILVDGQGMGTIVNDDVNVCTQTFTPIYTIQGNGSATTIPGNVTTQGVVVGDFETTAGVQGFYIQDATGDADATTSDGILVFTGAANTVNAGDVVRVTGFARERFNQTAIQGANDNNAAVPAGNIVNCGTGGSVAVTDVTMPFSSTTFLERYEGMYIRFPQSLVIAEYFNYDQFGEIVLALPLDGETRPFTGTAIDEPGAPALARALANSLRRVTLDDAKGGSNPPILRHPNGNAFALDNRFRGGDLVQNAIGVLGFDFSLYRIYPTGPANYTSMNPRPVAPEPVGGTLRVAAMNTLNFFLTLDTTASDSGPGPCGGNANLDCRGADSSQPDEFPRQRTKLLAALAGLDADVIGLNELENTPGVDPLGDPTNGIVAGLNSIFGAGTYSYINTGVIGTDAIRVGLIYKPSVVTPIGSFQILDSTDDPRFIDTRSRPALAQTFEEIATGARFTVVVNHLKSKGSACVGDPDAGDGQGNCNGTRTLAAQALVDWLATDPTESNDPDFLIMGDLNSYAKEDPIDAIKAGSDDTAGTDDDFTNLIFDYQGPYAYSYTFDGQAGYLDHALANVSLASQISGAADWHINSDEPDVVDYDTSFKPVEQEALYEPNAYRSSDHDPVVVGLNLVNTAPVATNDTHSTNEDTALTVAAPGVLSNDTDAESSPLTVSLVSGPTHGTVTLNADGSFTYTPASNYNGPDSFTYKANDGHVDSNIATVSIMVNAVNDAPVAVNDSATVSKNGSGVIFILANDSDVEGDTLTVTSFTQPAHGTVTYSTKNKNFRYTPTRGFTGTDTFTYTISDGHGGTATATVTITVQ
jgi:uncharacterized protein